MQFHTAKLFLYQVAFFERNLQHTPASHLNILTEGLEGAKSFLDLYLWLPPKSEMALTNSEWIQLNFGVTLAAKFAIVSKDPSVEAHTRALRQRLNIDNVFRHLALRIGALVSPSGEGSKQKDIFYHYELRVRKIQNWYERMVQATGSGSPLAQQANLQVAAAANPRVPQRHPGSAASTPSPQIGMPSTVSSPPPPHHHHHPAQHPQQHSPQYPPSHTSQQALAYTNNLALPSGTVASVGMTQISSPYSNYHQNPPIAFPDLMNAPGWDSFTMLPLEENAWAFDVNSGYQGMNVPSPPAEGTWSSPGALQ